MPHASMIHINLLLIDVATFVQVSLKGDVLVLIGIFLVNLLSFAVNHNFSINIAPILLSIFC